MIFTDENGLEYEHISQQKLSNGNWLAELQPLAKREDYRFSPRAKVVIKPLAKPELEWELTYYPGSKNTMFEVNFMNTLSQPQTEAIKEAVEAVVEEITRPIQSQVDYREKTIRALDKARRLLND